MKRVTINNNLRLDTTRILKTCLPVMIALELTYNINNINDNMIKSNQDFSNRIESLQEKIELRSRASSKASSRAKLSAGEEPVVIETPRIVAPEAEVSMTAIIKDKADADDFAEVVLCEEHLSVLVTTHIHIETHSQPRIDLATRL